MAQLPQLDARDQRILGALMEKQVTVPGSYPMTLNALRTACNQTSSRDPVSAYDEQLVEAGAKDLKDRGLVRVVWADRGPRTLKYHQRLTEELNLDDRETALLTVLLLRGPQAPGELRTRTDRLHGFADRHEVETLLTSMAERELVRELPRQAGQKDQRWVHLLGEVASPADVDVPTPQTNILADGAAARDERVRHAYDLVASSYLAEVGEELADLPFERWLLARVAAEVGDYPVADAGCGPGHIAAYLSAQGTRIRGFDLSTEMVEQARRAFPGLDVQVGDLRRLLRPVDADGWGAVLSWYSLIHLAPAELPEAVAALARVIRPGGLLVLALHTGGEPLCLSEWFGHLAVDLEVVRHDRAAVLGAVALSGLIDVEWYLRGPRTERGEATERLYVVARREE